MCCVVHVHVYIQYIVHCCTCTCKSRLTMCKWWKCCSRLLVPLFSGLSATTCWPPAGLEVIGTVEEVGREQWMMEEHTADELDDGELELVSRVLFLLFVFLSIVGEVLLVVCLPALGFSGALESI